MHPTLKALMGNTAAVYDALPTVDTSDATRYAYARLVAELTAQFEVLTRLVDVSFTSSDPYPDSRAMFEDISRNGRLVVYTAGAELPTGHPFATLHPNGQTMNSIFRAVHDGLAHFPEGNSFSPTGETRAFFAHARLLTRDATMALATETIGQNSVYAVTGAFAEQKATLLPTGLINRWLAMEGRI